MDGAGRLRDGQLVTLLVGLGLELLAVHRAGRAFGPIHPAHVSVDPVGRPRLADVAAPAAWTLHDDWVALLRLGRHLGASGRAALLSWETVQGVEGVDLLMWLMDWATPQPLPLDVGRVGAPVMLLH